MPGTLTLLRKLLCTAGERLGAAGEPAGAALQRAAGPLVGAAASLVRHLIDLHLPPISNGAGALALRPSSDPADSLERTLTVLCQLVEAFMRCLSDWPALSAGLRALQNVAGPLPKPDDATYSSGLLKEVEAAAASFLMATANLASVAQATRGPALAGAHDACVAAVATACKLMLAVATQPGLRAVLAAESREGAAFWCGTALELLLGGLLAAQGAAEEEQQGDDAAEEHRESRLQAVALAVLAAFRASASVETAGVDEAEEEEGGRSERRDDVFVRILLFKLFKQQGAWNMLLTEGVLADIAAAALRMLARPWMDAEAAEALCAACYRDPRVALAIAAQPGFVELAAAPAPPGEPGLLHAKSDHHGDLLHAVDSTVRETLSPHRDMQAEDAAQMVIGAIRTGQPSLLAFVRTQKRLLAQLAAEQLAEDLPLPPPAGSEAEAVVAEMWALSLATRACANPACATLEGGSEAALKTRRCSACKAVRFCGEACSRQDWRRHKVACRLLAAEAARR
ncbi:hypothetical protein ABPG75_007601 [Micractinium tetrahymenae]